MRMVIAENCRFIPRKNVDDLHTDQYNKTKPKSTDADLSKISFYSQNSQLVEETSSNSGNLQ